MINFLHVRIAFEIIKVAVITVVVVIIIAFNEYGYFTLMTDVIHISTSIFLMLFTRSISV